MTHETGAAPFRTGPLDAYRLAACEAVGSVMELWGFKRVHGMVWMCVYLHGRGLGAGEIKDALGISSGLVSMTVHDLEHWGVIHRRQAVGTRRELYEAEANIWRPIMKVLREREYRRTGEALETLRGLRQKLARAGAHDPALKVAVRQLDHLLSWGELAHRLFGQFLELGGLMLLESTGGPAAGAAKTLSSLRRWVARDWPSKEPEEPLGP